MVRNLKTILSYGCCNLLVDTSKGQVVTPSGKHLADSSLIQYRLPKGVSCCHYQVIRNFTEKLVATNLIANSKLPDKER